MRVVADFDGTITRPRPTSWALLDQLEQLMPGYQKAAKAVYAKYHHYETDHTLSQREKTQKMQEWWHEALQIFAQFGMKEEYFEKVSVKDVMLREGISEAFDFLKTQNIPVLILSAGIHQTIEMVLSHHRIT